LSSGAGTRRFCRLSAGLPSSWPWGAIGSREPVSEFLSAATTGFSCHCPQPETASPNMTAMANKGNPANFSQAARGRSGTVDIFFLLDKVRKRRRVNP
jgi:hypothetical protein